MGIRYLNTFQINTGACSEYDVIIVGSGIAGLYTALNLDSKLKVLVLTKDSIYETNSNLAQGGIAACMDDTDYHLHVSDTLKAGCYHNLPEAVEVIVKEGKDNIHRLVDLGVNFDKTDDGDLKATREGGHSNYRVLHAKDATGREIIRALSEAIKERPNIEVMEHAFVIDLLTYNDACVGVLIQSDHATVPYLGKATVLATGGIGQLYQNSTNSVIASGDGIAMACRSGVKITDMEFIQFHPTALYTPNKDRNFLISEAVRGEGGILRNHDGVAFMENYHELKDLAPRDIVSRAIINEIERTELPYIYLDVTHLDASYLKDRFPTIYNECLTHGIDITKDLIPVCPVQHYLMGGIDTDLYGHTDLPRLYACGETAKTGSHGANRLASNSLLEAIVFGKRVAQVIEDEIQGLDNTMTFDYELKQSSVDESAYFAYVEEIQKIMTERVFIYRNTEDLTYAKESIQTIKEALEALPSNQIGFYKTYNMAIIALLVVDAALKRSDSIGTHMLLPKE